MPRILVVEDEPLIAMMLENWLTELQCEIVGPARSATQAFEILESETVHGVILDWRMGDGDTGPVADALRARGIPFALATGYGRTVEQFSGVPILSKPYVFDDVARAIRLMMEPRAA